MNFLFVFLTIKNFLTTVGLIVVIYYGLKFLGRLLFPIVVKKAVNNMQARQASYYTREQKHEGEVTVENNRRQQRQTSGNEGEYVDFEEIE